MTKTNQYYYDKLRDCYNLVCENEEKRNQPAAPIKKKKPTFEKSAFIKYGSGYKDQGSGSRIRTTQKDWDEAVEQPTKRKNLKEFLVDAGSTTTLTTARDKKNLDFMNQVFLSAKEIEDFSLWVGFVDHLL
jgi:hypothetical protein